MEQGDVTRLLELAARGDERARHDLIEQVYGELRRLAGGMMRSQRPGHTLQPTALVSEAWLSLSKNLKSLENRAHFFGAAAISMRRILVDYARRAKAQKRGAGADHVTFQELQIPAPDPSVDVLVLDQALEALGAVDARLLKVMELRYFAGCSLEEIAEVTGVSLATVKRDWASARAWLFDYLNR